MAAKIEVPYTKSWECPLALEQTFLYFSDFKKAVPGNFPGVEKFDEIRPGIFQWTFEKLTYGGYDLEIRFVTKLEAEPSKIIRVTPLPEPDGSRLSGEWRFEARGEKTQVSMNFTLELELPIPSFLKKMAAPIVQKEITKLFDRYASNVEKHFSP